MNTEQYTYLLEHPDKITAEETATLRDIIDAFPFFQSAQALYLKGLKNQESFAYNKALKKTASHTSDRAVLFDYITSERFLQNDVSAQIKEQETALRNLIITDIEDVSTILDEEEQAKASKILDPDLFVEKVDSEMTRARAEETLQVGKPLPFTKSEAHSFSEWLQLSTFTPIDRSQDETTQLEAVKTKEVITTLKNEENDEIQPTIKEEDSRERKRKIIDSFIETNPKISAIKPAQPEKKKIIKELPYSSESLMTETLARVYVEQKNFKKAKQAYRILSLKYPEKSGFFADQIRAVEQLEQQKD
ncbi:hypothetical protein [Dokdonia donghaensis]|uniref:Tetratricopeptide repeat protein n=1 Tax=Dokdonia donghaensis DSW-1 TaxID=1300343 RepID=A0A0A2GT23_9FLAO|nr:hypothetical protein [Dokdonia donghaensis]ANH58971.1 hypothetical protein I597_0028 [Dokdonia donghaensis DSW-1]KGO06404.1 hypothetical protein NV36_05820 [Dokdonia donghaensis DSW-1]